MPEHDFKDPRELTREAMETTRKLLKKAAFRRTLPIVGFMLLQIGIILLAFRFLGQRAPLLLSLMSLGSWVVVIIIFNQDINPAFKLSWTLLISLLPVGGSFMYLFITNNPGTTNLRKHTARVIGETEGLLYPEPLLMDTIRTQAPDVWNITNYLTRYGGGPAYYGSHVEFYPFGEDFWPRLLEELEKAEHFIFLEYFILAEGLMWDSMLEVLERKAREGVEVRLLYDGMGCLLKLPNKYYEELRRRGIQAQVFNPLKPMLSTIANFRDHRKIAVVDGKVAFTGGINLADEYINEIAPYGRWKDTAARVTGPAVDSFTLFFLQQWNVAAGSSEEYALYLNRARPDPAAPGFLIPYCDSPVDAERVGENVYLDILHRARNYAHIMTPYLIITNEMEEALIQAAKSGVDVKLILPHIPDKWYAFALARSYYKSLLSAGVKIYEYTPGFVHAKIFVADDSSAVVSTINLDFRSLYHHFECGVYLHQTEAIAAIERDYQKTLEDCQPVTLESLRSVNKLQLLLGRLLRIISPIL